MGILRKLQSLARAREQLEHCGKIPRLRLLEAVQNLRSLAALPDLVTAFFDKGPETLGEGAVQRFDNQDDVQILGSTKVEADLVHDQFAGSPADQHVLMLVARKVRPKAIDPDHHSNGSNNSSAACATRSSGLPLTLRYSERGSITPFLARIRGS